MQGYNPTVPVWSSDAPKQHPRMSRPEWRLFCNFKTLFWIFLILSSNRNSTSGEPKEYNGDMSCDDVSEDCVCILSGLLRELTNLIMWEKGEGLEDRIKTWKCKTFLRLPPKLELDGSREGLRFQTSQPQVMEEDSGGRKVPLLLGRFTRSSKETKSKKRIHFGVPTDEAFEEGIARVDPNGFHHYVTFGSTARFHCAGSPETPEFPDGSRISWKHFNGNPIRGQVITQTEINLTSFR